MSAQHTAKLLHNLEDKKSLVYGFPWWQMISCLLCASSILLVAPMCADPDTDKEPFKEIDWTAVDEDADVCLKVFEALSPNSNAARLASDMMQRLRKTRMMSQGWSLTYNLSESREPYLLAMSAYFREINRLFGDGAHAHTDGRGRVRHRGRSIQFLRSCYSLQYGSDRAESRLIQPHVPGHAV